MGRTSAISLAAHPPGDHKGRPYRGMSLPKGALAEILDGGIDDVRLAWSAAPVSTTSATA